MTAQDLQQPLSFHGSELYKTVPPKFGHEMLKLFGFDPTYINLNHGSFGSLPLPVRATCDELTTEIESNPDKFIRVNYLPRSVDLRQRIANFLGVDRDECVMVPNASHGIATVLRNFEWEKEDVLIGMTTTYGSVSCTLRYLSDRQPHPSIATFSLLFPNTHKSILEQFRDFIRSLTTITGSGTQAPPKRKMLAVIDSIASSPGVRLPWKEMVAICRANGIYTMVDGAHSIGQELDINLSDSQPDFWVSNCHKWLFAKRGCAVLYVPKRNQHLIKSSIPTPVVYKSPQDENYEGPADFATLFGWNGTIDHVPYFSVHAALDFRAWLGGERKINQYCHNLALAGGKRLAEYLGTRVMDEDGELTWNMVNVELPIPKHVEFTPEIEEIFRQKLLMEWNISAAYYRHNDRWWTRCSAQIWNDLSDFDALGKAHKDICAEIIKFVDQKLARNGGLLHGNHSSTHIPSAEPRSTYL